MKKLRLLIGVYLSVTISFMSLSVPQIEGCNDYESTESTTAQESIMELVDIQEDEDKIDTSQIDVYYVNLNADLEKLEQLKDDKQAWYIEYRNFAEKYSSLIDTPKTIYDQFSAEEIYFICRTVETECYSADFISKTHVASVILNRLKDETWGDNLIEIIKSPNQFSYFREEISDDTLLAVMYVYEFGDTANGALYFHSNEEVTDFYGKTYIFTDEVGHHFYR